MIEGLLHKELIMSKSQYNLDASFRSQYPVDEESCERRFDMFDDGEKWRRYFEIHLTRSHAGQILVGAANTGRDFPKRHFRDRQITHQSPQLMGNGWSTRFDGGLRSFNDPSILVAIYVVAGGGSYDEPAHEKRAYAYVVCREWDSSRSKWEQTCFYLRGRAADRCGILHDDGLEAVHNIIRTVENSFEKVSVTNWFVEQKEYTGWAIEKSMRDEPARLLSKVTNHMMEAFGQGFDFFKV